MIIAEFVVIFLATLLWDDYSINLGDSQVPASSTLNTNSVNTASYLV